MEVTMKLGTAVSLDNVLKNIIDTEDINDISLKFKLLTISKSLEPFISNFQMIRNQKIKEYGQENDDGSISISSTDTESLNKFSNDINTLIQTDITVSITKLKSKEVFNNGLTSEQLIGLYEIIEE